MDDERLLTDDDIKRRKEAAERLATLEVEGVPDPDTLSRELEAAHEPCGLDSRSWISGV